MFLKKTTDYRVALQACWITQTPIQRLARVSPLAASSVFPQVDGRVVVGSSVGWEDGEAVTYI